MPGEKRSSRSTGTGAEVNGSGLPGCSTEICEKEGTRNEGSTARAVEPIIEFLDKTTHFRVEDTVLITSGAPEILSSAVPKEMAEVESLVGSAK